MRPNQPEGDRQCAKFPDSVISDELTVRCLTSQFCHHPHECHARHCVGTHRLLLSLPTSLAPELQVWFKDLFPELWQRQDPRETCV